MLYSVPLQSSPPTPCTTHRLALPEVTGSTTKPNLPSSHVTHTEDKVMTFNLRQFTTADFTPMEYNSEGEEEQSPEP